MSNIREDIDQLEFSSLLVGMHSGTAILRNSLLVSLKFIYAAAIQSSLSLLFIEEK